MSSARRPHVCLTAPDPSCLAGGGTGAGGEEGAPLHAPEGEPTQAAGAEGEQPAAPAAAEATSTPPHSFSKSGKHGKSLRGKSSRHPHSQTDGQRGTFAQSMASNKGGRTRDHSTALYSVAQILLDGAAPPWPLLLTRLAASFPREHAYAFATLAVKGSTFAGPTGFPEGSPLLIWDEEHMQYHSGLLADSHVDDLPTKATTLISAKTVRVLIEGTTREVSG